MTTPRLASAVLTLLLSVAAVSPLPAFAALPDSRDLDAVLLRNVRGGFIDYDGFAADPAFSRFVTGLNSATPADLADRDTTLAFYINAYNALAIRGVLDGGSIETSSARRDFFARRAHAVVGTTMTLEQIQTAQLLPLKEPRVHFALANAAISGPRLQSRAFAAADLDAQLDQATRAFANDPTRNRFDTARRVAFLSNLFAVNQREFDAAAGSVQRFLARYVDDPDARALLAADGFAVRYVPADWQPNGTYRNAPN